MKGGMVMEYVDFPVIDKFNAAGGVVVLIATYIFGEHWYLFIAYMLLNLFDYITGMAKGIVLQRISSSAGRRGIIKKLMNWVVLAIAFGMTPVLNTIGTVIGADVSAFSPLIGYYVLSTLIVNEATSILENLVQMGVPVPDFFVKLLAVAGKVLTTPGEVLGDKLDGRLDVHMNTNENEKDYQVHIDTPKETLIDQDIVTLKINTIHDE